jgi:hypothetical protein
VVVATPAQQRAQQPEVDGSSDDDRAADERVSPASGQADDRRDGEDQCFSDDQTDRTQTGERPDVGLQQPEGHVDEFTERVRLRRHRRFDACRRVGAPSGQSDSRLHGA